MFCILYALTAIPIFGFVNIRVSQFMKQRYNGVKYRTFGKSPLKWQNNLSFTFYMLFGVGILFLLPAYGFSFLEGWSYADSGIGLVIHLVSGFQAYQLHIKVYFTVISLTTIGFGDYSPSFEGSEETGIPFMAAYRILVLFWMMIGNGFWTWFRISDSW